MKRFAPAGWHPISVAAARCNVTPSMIGAWIRGNELEYVMAESPVQGPRKIRYVKLQDVQKLAWDARRRSPTGRIREFRTVPFTRDEKEELVRLRDLYSETHDLGTRRMPIRRFVLRAVRLMIESTC